MKTLESSPNITTESRYARELEHQQPHPEQQAASTAEHAEALGALSVTELMRQVEIDEATVVRFARQSSPQVNNVIQKAEAYAQFTPAVASAISYHNEPTVERIYPTAAEIKQQSWGARFVSGFLGIFSSRWEKRFDNYLESKANHKLNLIARKATAKIDAIGGVARPKEQFVSELSSLYNRATQDPSQREGLLQAIQQIESFSDEEEDGRDKKQFPRYHVLNQLSRLTGLTGRVDKMSIRAATPEIMQGMERFLKGQNIIVESAQTAEKPTVARRLMQRFKPRKLAGLPEQIEAALLSAYNVLPADGKRFKEGVYALCKNVTLRAQQGESGRDLTKKLVTEVRNLIDQGYDRL